ncbi:ECs_2282 family putative zinc-binding protein [Escherichia coli]|uniref:ECs_2282 family putative zinc-binding protein n=6 Tax=Escherichia coli TaxID=562 RepID=UPI000A578007|nr:hypothetical protein [Escherichia coli]DAE42355.1 MAG TPA: 50S ribosomal subunit [Caudoviricetes sp.]HDW3846171.1 hypothetical protein [Escherichia coli O100:H12]EEZ0873684.1 hypothetical protein [Escherichia coli]EEZ8972678.1 hypothetical protein [Escherichia coli]EFB6704305.1 hypothetical protein [Escherichia coli]
MSPHSAALITMLCTIRSAHHGEMNHCFACSFRFTHALTLCRYPLMREKCFVVQRRVLIFRLPSMQLQFTALQNIPVIAGVFIRARRALSRYSPTARNRLLFKLPNSRKDMFMQTMRTVCPDCGSEMFNQPDDFDFETNFTGVSCADCGREITKDDVVNQATDTVKKQIDDMLRNSLKGAGWKFK